jgi:hypothetical protein
MRRIYFWSFSAISFGAEQQGETMKINILLSLIAALFAMGLSDLSISYAAEPEVATVKDFKWGDQTNLKEHLLKHVTFPATKSSKRHAKTRFLMSFPKSSGPTWKLRLRTTVPITIRQRLCRL